MCALPLNVPGEAQELAVPIEEPNRKSGNTDALKWWGKQYLGQVEKRDKYEHWCRWVGLLMTHSS